MLNSKKTKQYKCLKNATENKSSKNIKFKAKMNNNSDQKKKDLIYEINKKVATFSNK